MNAIPTFSHLQTSPAQETTAGYGIPPWAWFLIIVFIILLVWWLLVRSAERQNETLTNLKPMHDEEPGHSEKSPPVEVKPEIDKEPDDLTRIEGIGPKVSAALVNAGIKSYETLAKADVNDLKQILESAGYKYMDPGTWPEQAGLLSEGKSEEFKLFIEGLKGGRKR